MTVTEPAARPACACVRTSSPAAPAPMPPSRSTPRCSAPGSSATSSAATTGAIGHCELDIDGNGLYLADAYPEYGIDAPDPAVGVALHLEVADADATVARAEAAGATVLQPVDDRFYGSRSGTIRDPFGHQWQIDQPGAVSPLGRSRRAWPTTATLRDRRPRRAGPGRPAHPHGGRGRQRQRAGRRLLHPRRPRPRPSGGVLRRAPRLGRPPARRGLPHRERLPARRHRRLGHRARRHDLPPGATMPPALAQRVRELGGTVLSRRPTRPAAAPAASTTRACPSPLAARPRLLKEHRGPDRPLFTPLAAVHRRRAAAGSVAVTGCWTGSIACTAGLAQLS